MRVRSRWLVAQQEQSCSVAGGLGSTSGRRAPDTGGREHILLNEGGDTRREPAAAHTVYISSVAKR